MSCSGSLAELTIKLSPAVTIPAQFPPLYLTSARCWRFGGELRKLPRNVQAWPCRLCTRPRARNSFKRSSASGSSANSTTITRCSLRSAADSHTLGTGDCPRGSGTDRSPQGNSSKLSHWIASKSGSPIAGSSAILYEPCPATMATPKADPLDGLFIHIYTDKNTCNRSILHLHSLKQTTTHFLHPDLWRFS